MSAQQTQPDKDVTTDVVDRLNDWATALEFGDGNPYGAGTLREAARELVSLRKWRFSMANIETNDIGRPIGG